MTEAAVQEAGTRARRAARAARREGDHGRRTSRSDNVICVLLL
jgi:DNA integrity scanning protein DisA with diadenylate cyclase activity